MALFDLSPIECNLIMVVLDIIVCKYKDVPGFEQDIKKAEKLWDKLGKFRQESFDEGAFDETEDF